MEIRTIGIDLGKTVFHLIGVDARGEAVVRKKCSRTQLLRFTSNVPKCLIGMEACAGSHFLGRALREQGHDVRLMPAQYVKPYVKTNKNDFIDAEACAEAVTRPTMRFVPIKTDDQLDLQSLHRVRERWVRGRTAVINQIRGLLLERGITVRKGRRHIEESLPGILEDPDNKLSGALRVLLRELRREMQYLHGQIDECDKLLVHIASELEDCERPVAVPGVGPTTATAMIAAIGNGAAFKKGRGFAAWLGVVPGEHSTGGKQTLTGTSRRGNKYLRKLFLQGAHSVLQSRSKQDPVLSAWLEKLVARKRIQVAAIALANKMARMAWAVLYKGENYRPPLLPKPDGLQMTPA
jgi:transposase